MDAIAYYLPQYHSIPENDAAWGKGFTEWTNVAKARRLYPGHYQPKLPADLGFYDLRLEEVQEEQDRMAIDAGIAAFAYWYYWLGSGRRLLEMPLNRMRANHNIKMRYCLAWANESWTGIWHGSPKKLIAEQKYPANDERLHALELAKYFADERYYRINGRPVFTIYKPQNLPKQYLATLRRELEAMGESIYAIAVSPEGFDYKQAGFDGLNLNRLSLLRENKLFGNVERLLFGGLSRTAFSLPRIRSYEKAVASLNPKAITIKDNNIFPTVVPNWDNSPRSGRKSLVLHGSTPQKYGQHLRKVCNSIRSRPLRNQILFIKSWNEWAEGNYLEPDLKYRRGYLMETKAILNPD